MNKNDFILTEEQQKTWNSVVLMSEVTGADFEGISFDDEETLKMLTAQSNDEEEAEWYYFSEYEENDELVQLMEQIQPKTLEALVEVYAQAHKDQNSAQAEYCMKNIWRLAWYKVHYPKEYKQDIED